MTYQYFTGRAVIAALIMSTFAAPACAYIDPGAGSIAIQMIMAGVLAGIYKARALAAAAKRLWEKLIGKTDVAEKTAKSDHQ